MCRRTRRIAPSIAFVIASFAPVTGALSALAQEATSSVSPTAGEVKYTTTLLIEDESEEIRDAVQAASLLVSLEDEPLDTPGALLLRGREDQQRVRRALNALGYFGARVKVTVAGEGASDPEAEDRLSVTGASGPVNVEIAVSPGPLFRLADVAIKAKGGDAKGLPDTLTPSAIGLKPGRPARSADIVAAGTRAVEVLREAGYPLALESRRDAVADHASATLDLVLQYDPAQLASMGSITVLGTDRMKPDFVAGLAPFQSGEQFRASLLKEYRDNIERLGVFDSLVIEEPKELTAEGQLPLTVKVHERPRRAIGVAANWSTLEGAAVSSYWEHRNLFGEAEKLRVEATSSRLFLNALQDYEFALQGILTLPAWPDRRDDMQISLAARKERPDAYERDALEMGLGWTRRFDQALAVEAGVALSRASEEDAFGTRNLTTLSVPTAILYDTRNDPLEPVRGLRASMEFRPFVNLDDTGSVTARVLAQSSAYVSLDPEARTVLAGRIAAGMTLGQDVSDLPADLRFFSGGGGSVRGYAYQGLSPRDALGRILGGASVAEAALEVRHWVYEDIGVAMFADAGAAFSADFPDFQDMGTGLGLGIRYRTPVGPLRLDVAIPLDPQASDPDFSLYVGLGQAF